MQTCGRLGRLSQLRLELMDCSRPRAGGWLELLLLELVVSLQSRVGTTPGQGRKGWSASLFAPPQGTQQVSPCWLTV